MVRYMLSALLLGAPAALNAQARGDALAQRAREALAPVARMVGQWEGTAEIVQGPGEPIRVHQSEDIVYGASRTVIMIRGTGRDPATGDIVFEAAGMLWFDTQAGRLRFRAHRDGNAMDADVEARPDTLQWGFAVPGGRVRYLIALTDSSWHEVGYFEREGAPPFKTTEMRLRRRGPRP
jgi:hypothetical protein